MPDLPAPPKPPSATQALQRLRDGNLRFVRNVRSVDSLLTQSARRALVRAQAPFAVILSCSDSRAPAELVFDQGLGDLFVVRVAGNVAAVALVGSVEFAVSSYGTELVVVMGHSHCGVIASMVDGVGAEAPVSANVRHIFDHVRPAIEEVLRSPLANPGSDRAALLSAATRANVRWSANQLRRGSELIAERVRRGKVLVVGAEYSLDTGEVDFFDGAPG